MDMTEKLDQLPGCFIAGQAKSGTTLLVSLLDGHPDLLAFPEETSFYPALERGYGKRGRDAQVGFLLEKSLARFILDAGLQGGGGRDYSDFPRERLRERFLELARGREHAERNLLVLLVQAYGEMVGCDFGRLVNWVEKTPGNRDFLDAILADFPRAKILLTMRDPRAVLAARLQRVRENYEKRRGELHLFDNVRNWRVAATVALRWRERVKNLHVVRFEELLSETEATMRGVAKFLEIEFNDSLLVPTKAGKDWSGNSATKQSFKKVSTEPIDRWRGYLTEAEVGWVEYHCGELMDALGYERVLERTTRAETLRRIPGETFKHYVTARRRSVQAGIFGWKGEKGIS
jgi:hypothetical protein